MTSNVNHRLKQKSNPEEILEVVANSLNPLQKDRLILSEVETRTQLIMIN